MTNTQSGKVARGQEHAGYSLLLSGLGSVGRAARVEKRRSCHKAVGVATHSERDFQVLSTPDVHACVISANLLEIISVDRKQASCHGGSSGKEREYFIFKCHNKTHTHTHTHQWCSGSFVSQRGFRSHSVRVQT